MTDSEMLAYVMGYLQASASEDLRYLKDQVQNHYISKVVDSNPPKYCLSNH